MQQPSLLKNEDLGVFVTAAMDFFNINLGEGQILAGSPRRATGNDTLIYDYTGKINISGDREGCIYFSSPEYLIKHLLISMGETDLDDELVRDLVGEIANSIAGSAQSHFGKGFILSTPLISTENDESDGEIIPDELLPYVVPLKWRDHSSNIVIWFS